MNHKNENKPIVYNNNDDNEFDTNEEIVLVEEKSSLFNPDNYSKEFIQFLKDNEIPLDSYDIKEIPRFIRVKPNSPSSLIKQIEKELGTILEPIEWLPNFYQFSSSIKISQSDSYKSGKFYGIDASSGAAILALDPQPGENILDICCAPGTKLCMISDLININNNNNKNNNGSVTGVDISETRLSICKSILKKYNIPNARLFICDASTFTIKSPSPTDPIPKDKIDQRKLSKKLKLSSQPSTEFINTSTIKYDEHINIDNIDNNNNNSSSSNDTNSNDTNSNNTNLPVNNNNNNEIIKKYKSKKRNKKSFFDLENLYFSNQFWMRYSNSKYYDRVIIDAECSLDASIRHLLLHSKVGVYQTSEKLKELTDLQKKLIQTGFNLIKPNGGTLVYSTCSFIKEQNEFVVQWLLDNNSNAELIPAFKEDSEKDKKIPYSKGFIDNTYRFYPKNGTSGLFIAKVIKK